MKWLGQHIWDKVTQFRNSVYGTCPAFRITCDDVRFISDQAHDPMVQIRGEANDATGPRLRLMKTRGADGQDNDVCGTIQFYSYDDGVPQTQSFAEIQGTIHDATASEESGKLTLGVASHDGGVDNGLVLTGGSSDAEVDVTIANGTASVTTIAGTLTMGSTAFVNNSGVVQVATQGTIDHDSLANFVANEHIDWTGSSAGTIHSTNIPTLNQNTTGSAATLTTERDLQVNLASTSADGFDGGGNATDIGVSGTLPVGNGGTGNTSGNATGLTASTSNSIGVGSIELGHADDTTIARSAAGKITVEGKEVRTADRQIQAVYASFQASDIETKHYLAFNDGDSENTDAAHVDMPIVAPVAGKLLSVSMRQTRNTSTHDYTIRLETQAVGVAHATGPSVVGTVTGTNNAPTNTNMVTYDFSGVSSNAIAAGDYVYISIESDTAPGGSTKYFFTCLFEWDYSSI